MAEGTDTAGTGTVPLGHEVFQIDTRMAGYDGITAGYLIRGDRPCLVETGTAPSAPVVRDALAGLGIGPGDLATPVSAILIQLGDFFNRLVRLVTHTCPNGQSQGSHNNFGQKPLTGYPL